MNLVGARRLGVSSHAPLDSSRFHTLQTGTNYRESALNGKSTKHMRTNGRELFVQCLSTFVGVHFYWIVLDCVRRWSVRACTCLLATRELGLKLPTAGHRISARCKFRFVQSRMFRWTFPCCIREQFFLTLFCHRLCPLLLVWYHF